MKRSLSKDGFTEKAEITNNNIIELEVEKLCKIFKPIGPTNFQFRKQNEQFKLLEINPRISSSTSIRSKFGYNESEMSVQYFVKNISPKQPLIRHGKAIRYIEDYIVYE
jgi:carbamoyl-phosphate synthase large subunit